MSSFPKVFPKWSDRRDQNRARRTSQNCAPTHRLKSDVLLKKIHAKALIAALGWCEYANVVREIRHASLPEWVCRGRNERTSQS